MEKRIATAVRKGNYEQAKATLIDCLHVLGGMERIEERLVCRLKLESFTSRPWHCYAPFPEARLIPSFCIL